MRSELLAWLACPDCGGPFALEAFAADADGAGVEAGVLACRPCRGWYPVVDGIPRILGPHLWVWPEWLERHRGRLRGFGPEPDGDGGRGFDPLVQVQQETARRFGLEWNLWAKFGWGDYKGIEAEARTFWAKTLLEPADLDGRLVLDAGCGNGRYTYHAARHARAVVGVDLSQAVDAARRNLAGLRNVHLVQADIFHMPFPPGVFDIVFSIGVLMHTGAPGRAIGSLARHLRPGGTVCVHVYQRGNVIFELNDRFLRWVTTRMPSEALLSLAKATAWAARRLPRKLVGVVDAFVRFDPHEACVFDWYAAPVASHHSYPEVYAWFATHGLRPVRDGNRRRSPLTRLLWPGRAVTVRGVREAETPMRTTGGGARPAEGGAT